jgi:hypothetical protein
MLPNTMPLKITSENKWATRHKKVNIKQRNCTEHGKERETQTLKRPLTKGFQKFSPITNITLILYV